MLEDVEMFQILTRIYDDDILPPSAAGGTTDFDPPLAPFRSLNTIPSAQLLTSQSNISHIPSLNSHIIPQYGVVGKLPSVQQLVHQSSAASSSSSAAAAVAAASKKRRMTDSPNSEDLKIIAATTAEQVRLLDIDPESREGKKEQRRIRNRMSAMMHRERKKQYIETLEEEVREKKNMISRLQHDLSMALEENKQLRLRLQQQHTQQQQQQQQQQISSSAVPTGGHALTHQEFLGALARPLPTYPAPTIQPNSIPILLTRGRAGTTVTSNEGSGSDSECSVSDLNQMWNGDRSTSGLDSDDLDDGIRDTWREYLSSETSLVTPTPTSLTPSPASLSNSITPSLTPSPPVSPPPNQNRRRSVPLYSFVLFISGLSFFSGMFASSPLSFQLEDMLPPFQMPPSFNSVDSTPHIPSFLQVNGAIGGNAGAGASVGAGGGGGGGRVLLSLPSSEEDDINKLDSSNTYPHQLAPVIWSHPNHVTSIYPHPFQQVTFENENARPEYSQKKRKYLRTKENRSELNDTDVLTELTHVYSTKDLSLFYDNTWPSTAAAMSKIYLTEGRVLLDPSLVAAATTLPTQGNTDPSSLSKAIIPTWQTSTSESQSHSPSGTSSSSFTNMRSSTPSTSTTTTTSSISPNQLLTMIIPATTIQWGGNSWIDGDSPYASHNILDVLMRNMNLTSFAMENGLFDEETNNIDVSGLSIEIACNVLKARIVKDVGVIVN